MSGGTDLAKCLCAQSRIPLSPKHQFPNAP